MFELRRYRVANCCRVIPLRKIALNLNGEVNYWELAQMIGWHISWPSHFGHYVVDIMRSVRKEDAKIKISWKSIPWEPKFLRTFDHLFRFDLLINQLQMHSNFKFIVLFIGWQLHVAFVLTGFLVFKPSGHIADTVRPTISSKICGITSVILNIFWEQKYWRQVCSFVAEWAYYMWSSVSQNWESIVRSSEVLLDLVLTKLFVSSVLFFYGTVSDT